MSTQSNENTKTKNNDIKLNLVKYAGEFWVTLAEYALTRDTKGYSDYASVKSAIRTFVIRQSADKYIAFRGEAQIKNVVRENKDNPLFDPADFEGTRLGLIHFSLMDTLDERFSVFKNQAKRFKEFLAEADKVINTVKEDTDTSDIAKTTIIRHLRNDLNRLDKEIEVRQRDKEKLMQALNSLESLESLGFDDAQ